MNNQLYQWVHVYAQEWADLTWLPIALFIVHKGQKIKACAFMIVCMVVMRLQIQSFEMMGLTKGVTGFFDWPLIYRGYAVYGFFVFLFLILSYFSPRTRGPVYLAASFTIFFMAFAVSSIVMIF